MVDELDPVLFADRSAHQGAQQRARSQANRTAQPSADTLDLTASPEISCCKNYWSTGSESAVSRFVR